MALHCPRSCVGEVAASTTERTCGHYRTVDTAENRAEPKLLPWGSASARCNHLVLSTAGEKCWRRNLSASSLPVRTVPGWIRASGRSKKALAHRFTCRALAQCTPSHSPPLHLEIGNSPTEKHFSLFCPSSFSFFAFFPSAPVAACCAWCCAPIFPFYLAWQTGGNERDGFVVSRPPVPRLRGNSHPCSSSGTPAGGGLIFSTGMPHVSREVTSRPGSGISTPPPLRTRTSHREGLLTLGAGGAVHC